LLRRILDSPWLYFGLAGVLAIAALLSMVRYEGPGRDTGTLADLDSLRTPPSVNVLFILIDTLRADRLGSYGYERETTPYIDDLARQGIRFANVQSQSSWTKTSMASLWTSVYPARTGVLHWDNALPPEPTLPAEIFREAGFRTTGIVRNGWVEANFGFDRGFETYIMPHPIRTAGRFQQHNPSSHPLQGNDENLTRTAEEFLRSNGHERFLLYVHYMDLHQYTYDSASGLFGSTYSDAYDNALHWTDRNIGGLVRTLKDLDLFDKTLIVIASDHGEAFSEHGNEGHARDLHQEVTTTPWIISLPFALEQPVVVEETVANVDIWPTLLDLLGLPALEGVDGRSTLPLIRSGGSAVAQEDPEGRTIFAQIDQHWGNDKKPSRPLVAVTRPPHRLIFESENPDRLKLYDLSQDPGETHNLATEQPELAEELRAEGEAYLSRAAELSWSSPEVEINEMRRRQLMALGYVEDEK
jgi:arylsulfatase A-like enzyme